MYSHCDGSLLVTLSFISRSVGPHQPHYALRHMFKQKKVDSHSIFCSFFLFSPKSLSAFSLSCTNKIGIWHCAVVAVVAVTINCKLQTVLVFHFEAVSIQYYSKLCLARNTIMWHFRCSSQTFKRHTHFFSLMLPLF